MSTSDQQNIDKPELAMPCFFL